MGIKRRRVLVRGTGDIASAVAHALFRAGFAVAMHDGLEPGTPRRRMAFSDALFDGAAELDGVTARRTNDTGELVRAVDRSAWIPVTALPFVQVHGAVTWDAVVDARMRKRAQPEPQRHLAPVTIGLGPGFVAGDHVSAAVETSWEDLGRVVRHGSTLPLRGEPRTLAGAGRERYVYAPVAGRFATSRAIGEAVTAGETVARVDGMILTAPIDGAIRGLLRDGLMVAAATKVVEIDPRGPAAVVSGIGERPRRLAEGVLEALRDCYDGPAREDREC